MRTLLILAAAAAAMIPAVAEAAEPPCLTPSEFTSLATYALPSAITGASQRCAASLPRTAFIERDAVQLAQSYSAAKAAAWPGAKAAFLKVGSTINPQAQDVFRTLPDNALQPLVDGVIVGVVSEKLPLDRCAAVDRLVTLLSPLPPQSTAELIGLAVGLGSKPGPHKLGKFAICPA